MSGHATQESYTGDATESSEHHPVINTIRTAEHKRDLPRLSPPHAFPNQPRPLHRPCMDEYARSVMVSREAEM